MEKEEFTKEIQSLLNTLENHESDLHKLVEDLRLIVRPTGDVNFVSLDRAKAALASMKEAKDAAEKVKKVLKARAVERMKDV